MPLLELLAQIGELACVASEGDRPFARFHCLSIGFKERGTLGSPHHILLPAVPDSELDAPLASFVCVHTICCYVHVVLQLVQTVYRGVVPLSSITGQHPPLPFPAVLPRAVASSRLGSSMLAPVDGCIAQQAFEHEHSSKHLGFCKHLASPLC